MSEVQGRPAGTMSMERRFGIAISVGLILGGAYWALTGMTEDTKNEQTTYAIERGALKPGEVAPLTIETGSADVVLRSGNVDKITVDKKYDRNVFGSAPKESYEDGTLKIRDSGCGFLSFGCDTEYVVTVPTDVKVTVESSSGNLKVSDLPGGLTAETSSGSIEANRVAGEVSLKSSSGSIQGDGLSAKSVTADSSSGSIELTFVQAPETVIVESESGDLAVRLPSGQEKYKVVTDTKSGDKSEQVTTDPSSTRSVTAETKSGDVAVEYAD